VLTCAKPLWFCETQHRNVASLRRSIPDPLVEVHPATAEARGIGAGDWVHVRTPHGDVRARAKLRAARLVAGLCGARPARPPAVRPGQRQPQPRAAAGAERPDQRELSAAGVGVRPRATRRRGRRGLIGRYQFSLVPVTPLGAAVGRPRGRFVSASVSRSTKRTGADRR
jgi:hypothetical protein